MKTNLNSLCDNGNHLNIDPIINYHMIDIALGQTAKGRAGDLMRQTHHALEYGEFNAHSQYCIITAALHIAYEILDNEWGAYLTFTLPFPVNSGTQEIFREFNEEHQNPHQTTHVSCAYKNINDHKSEIIICCGPNE